MLRISAPLPLRQPTRGELAEVAAWVATLAETVRELEDLIVDVPAELAEASDHCGPGLRLEAAAFARPSRVFTFRRTLAMLRPTARDNLTMATALIGSRPPPPTWLPEDQYGPSAL